MILARLMIGAAMTMFAEPLAAQVNCGDQPKDVPLEVQEELKGDVEGKAQLFTRLLGDTQLRGAINTSRHELNEKHQNVDKSQLDRYMLWTTCQAINADHSMTTQEKIDQYVRVYRALQSPASQLEPDFAVSLDDAGISLIDRGGKAFNVEEQDDARFWIWCHRWSKEVMTPLMGAPKRATEGVVRFWELRGLRNGLAKVTGLIKKKFPNVPLVSGPFTLEGPISAGFRMRISVDYEGAGRIAHGQYFGISCESTASKGDDVPCQVLELGSREYAEFLDGYLGKVTTPVFFSLLGSFGDSAIEDAIGRCQKTH